MEAVPGQPRLKHEHALGWAWPDLPKNARRIVRVVACRFLMLPFFLGEGIQRSVLEALANAGAVITHLQERESIGPELQHSVVARFQRLIFN